MLNDREHRTQILDSSSQPFTSSLQGSDISLFCRPTTVTLRQLKRCTSTTSLTPGLGDRVETGEAVRRVSRSADTRSRVGQCLPKRPLSTVTREKKDMFESRKPIIAIYYLLVKLRTLDEPAGRTYCTFGISYTVSLRSNEKRVQRPRKNNNNQSVA